MSKLKTISFLLLFTSIVYSCGYLFGERVVVEIPNVSKEWTDTIKVNIPENKYIHKLVVELKGQTSSGFILNGQEFKSGKIDMKLKEGDHYSSDYILDYKPSNEISEGNLSVNLIFYYN